jgi:hypothetical protein
MKKIDENRQKTTKASFDSRKMSIESPNAALKSQRFPKRREKGRPPAAENSSPSKNNPKTIRPSKEAERRRERERIFSDRGFSQAVVGKERF